MSELKVQTTTTPVIWCDNLSAAAIATNLVYHARTKHIEINTHFVRDMVLQKDIEVRCVPIYDQIADDLTIGLSIAAFLKLKDKLQVKA